MKDLILLSSKYLIKRVAVKYFFLILLGLLLSACSNERSCDLSDYRSFIVLAENELISNHLLPARAGIIDDYGNSEQILLVKNLLETNPKDNVVCFFNKNRIKNVEVMAKITIASILNSLSTHSKMLSKRKDEEVINIFNGFAPKYICEDKNHNVALLNYKKYLVEDTVKITFPIERQTEKYRVLFFDCPYPSLNKYKKLIIEGEVINKTALLDSTNLVFSIRVLTTSLAHINFNNNEVNIGDTIFYNLNWSGYISK